MFHLWECLLLSPILKPLLLKVVDFEVWKYFLLEPKRIIINIFWTLDNEIYVYLGRNRNGLVGIINKAHILHVDCGRQFAFPFLFDSLTKVNKKSSKVDICISFARVLFTIWWLAIFWPSFGPVSCWYGTDIFFDFLISYYSPWWKDKILFEKMKWNL